MNHAEFQGEVKGVQIGNHNIIYNYFYYREEVKPPSGDVADEDLPCPYRGLFHFGPNDADVFFGREIFIEKLYSATQTRNFIPVLGASGSGKSSVVFAGLVPQLQKAGHWQFTYFRPGSDPDPFYALAEALVPLYREDTDSTDKMAQAGKLARDLKDGTTPLFRVFNSIQRKHQNHRLLLIADQFEEIYTVCKNQEIRHKFFDCLLTSLETPTSPSSLATVWVTTMRADFLGNALSYRPFADVLLQNPDVKLTPMNREELTRVIEKPAQKLGVTFEAGLVERILKDVKDKDIEDKHGNLPLLEFALTKLWSKRTGKQLTHKIYEEIGRVEGALARHADEKYGNLTNDEKEKVRKIFIQLVLPGEGIEDTRRIAKKAELGEQNWSLVKKLADARLVVTSRNLASQETVEVVHEALIHNWGELREWMNTNRTFRVWQERLRAAKNIGSLLRGAALAEAEERLKKRPEDLIDEREFIEQSIKENNRQRQRTIIGLTSFSVVASVLALVAGINGWNAATGEKNYRLIAGSQSSEALFASNKQFDALLESIRTGKQMQKDSSGITAQTEMQVVTILMQSLYGVKERNRFEGYDQPFMRAVFSSDGTKIAAATFDNTIQIWNLKGEEIATVNQKNSGAIGNLRDSLGSCSANSVSFSSKSDTIVASDGNDIKFWDFNGRELPTSFLGKGKEIALTSISNDGKLIATVSNDGQVNILNRKGQEIDTFQHSDTNSLFLAVSNPIFSPDNNFIASADGNNNLILRNLNTKTSKTLKNDGTVCSLDFNSNNSELAFTEVLARVKLSIIKNQKSTFFEDVGVISIIHSPEGFVSTHWDGSIKFWHRYNNEWQVKSSWLVHSAPVWNVSFSPDKKMLVSVSDDKTVKLWNLEGVKQPSFRPSDGSVGDISISPDGKTIATVTADASVKLSALNGTIRQKPLQKINSFSKITFSPDSKYLVSSSSELIQIWDINSGESKTLLKQKLSIGYKRNDFGRASFSRDGKTIAVGKEDGTIQLLRPDGTKIKTLEGGSKIVSYSPDGQIIASASNHNTIKLWRADGKELRTLEGSSYPITSVSFSPDSKSLVAGNQNGNIIIWSINGKRLPTLQGHNSAVSGLTFRRDSKIFASASYDGTIKFWSLDGMEIKTFKTNSNEITGINFSRDGKMLVWANQFEVIIWNLDLNDLLSKGCDWVRDYLQNVSKEDKHLCDDIGKK